MRLLIKLFIFLYLTGYELLTISNNSLSHLSIVSTISSNCLNTILLMNYKLYLITKIILKTHINTINTCIILLLIIILIWNNNNFIQGPYQIRIKRILSCNPTSHNIQFNFYLDKKSFNSTEIKGNVTSQYPFDDSLYVSYFILKKNYNF